MFCEHHAKLYQKGIVKDGACAKCLEQKVWMQFKYCKLQCFNCNECGWFYGADHLLAGKPAVFTNQKQLKETMDPKFPLNKGMPPEIAHIKWHIDYTADSIRLNIAPKWDFYYSKLTIGQLPTWNCDQRTKDNFCLTQWLQDELTRLQAPDDQRIQTIAYFNRKARAEEDLYQVATTAMNHYLNNTLDDFVAKYHR